MKWRRAGTWRSLGSASWDIRWRVIWRPPAIGSRSTTRTAARSEAWLAEHKGRAAATPREAAEGASAVFVCVGNDDDVRSVSLGDDGVFAGADSGSVVIDHTTASADLARELASVGATRGGRLR